MKRILSLVAATLLLAGVALAGAPPDAEIRKIIHDRLAGRTSVGIVVGVIDADGRRVIAEGVLDAGDKRPLNGDTLFEIGSVTKVFTSLLLAEAVQRGEVALTDPVAKFLPSDVKVPERGGKKITLLDLATHTSGLPRLPTNSRFDGPNPYAGYTSKQLYDFLSGYQLPRDIGSKFEYSNLGAGVLGNALSRRAGMDYETLLRTRITAPLGMKSTAITLSDALKQRLAPGHDVTGARVSNWDLGALAGAGAIRSTANDLLEFLAAELGYTKSPLAAAMAAQLVPRRPTGAPGLSIALAWHVLTTPAGNEVVWHNGGTGGYHSFAAYDVKSRAGVVVLTNIAASIDEIGMQILDPSARPKPGHALVVVDPKVLGRYVGRYALTPDFIITVTHRDGLLFVQATGQQPFELSADDEKNFNLKGVNAQITFEGDGLILHQNGAHKPAKRILGGEVVLDPVILDRYIGRYELMPGFVIAVTREGKRLLGQATGQPPFHLFAEDEHNFYLVEVNARITFETDAQGRATKLILHQNGDHPGKRIE
jgi:CubicO group peptidase (beta-lactamase class C family)